jgi:parvulin-like peptidyl-prolyl isomerase
MNRADAAAILQVPPTASPEEARRAYQELFTEHQVRLTNAPTPALRNLYQARLRELDEARDAMSSETSVDDIDLPLAEPKIPDGSASGWRSEESTKSPPPPPPPKPREPQQAPPAPTTNPPARDLDGETSRNIGPPNNSKRNLIIVGVLALIGVGGFLATRSRGTTALVASANTFTPADSAIALGRVRWLYTRIDQGEKFEDVARKESDDSATAAEGGDLGVGKEHAFGPEFFEVASHAPREPHTSFPVLTPFGYHLIQKDSSDGDKLHLHHILVRIRPVRDETKAFVVLQLKQNLTIAKTEFARGDYDAADRALRLAEAFSSSPRHIQPTAARAAAEDSVGKKLKPPLPPTPYAQEAIVGPLREQVEGLRDRIDRACETENQIAQQRSEPKPCKHMESFRRPW